MIDILLATYNGENYLKEQIDSIFAQTNQGWRLLIRDDCSQDRTVTIIKDYVIKHSDKVRLITDDTSHLGPYLSFGRLLEYSTSEHIMFSDQDDVWLRNKIELSLNMMKSAELIYPNIPLLIHGDLRVVDCNLNVIADSHWAVTRISPSIGDDVNKVMVEGLVSGNTMIINKKAREISVPIPEDVGHDRWISIKVAQHGKILYTSVPCILYRQHSSSCVGSSERNVWCGMKNLFHFKRQLLVYRTIYRMIKKSAPNFSRWKFVKTKVILLTTKLLRCL